MWQTAKSQMNVNIRVAMECLHIEWQSSNVKYGSMYNEYLIFKLCVCVEGAHILIWFVEFHN